MPTNSNVSSSKKSTIKSASQLISFRSSYLVIPLVSLALFFFWNKNDFIIFASQSDVLTNKSETVVCSKILLDEIIKYKSCVPNECGRLVTDSVVLPIEVETLLAVAEKGLAKAGSSGGASILDLHSGAVSNKNYFINMYKSDKFKDVFTEMDFKVFNDVKNKIKNTIAKHFGANSNKLYLTHPTFFSEIKSTPAVTIHDEYWHPHVDKETYKSFHYTSLLYLSDYKIDFEGGRFIFIDNNGNKTVEPRKGRVSTFTSGSENLHYVEKVTSGVRYAITISFTCDESYAIEDPSLSKFEH